MEAPRPRDHQRSGDSAEYAVVTGAASGIGRAVAQRLAARGAQLGLVDIDSQKLAGALAELNKVTPGSQAFEVSVTDSRRLREAMEEFAGRRGRIDTVVSCAGILRMGTVTDMPEADWKEVLEVNLTGTFLAAKHAMSWLMRRGGAFVAISSDAGTCGASGYSAYCASKHGVLGLVKCLALDYGPYGVRSNAICPSFVETPMADVAFAGTNAEERRYYKGLVPLGRFAQPEEIAAIAAHLSSRESSYVNGAAYAVDGGATAGYFSASVGSNA